MQSPIPKPLIELSHTQTVLSRQLKMISRLYPNAEIIVVVGYEAEDIVKHVPAYVKIVENENYANTNVARSVGMGLRAMTHGNDVLIIYGDLVFTDHAIKDLIGMESVIVVDNGKRMNSDEVGATIYDGKVTQMTYGLTTKWTHIAFMTNYELKLFKKISTSCEAKRWYGFEVINKVIGMGGKFRVVEPKKMKIVEIDSDSDVKIAKRII